MKGYIVLRGDDGGQSSGVQKRLELGRIDDQVMDRWRALGKQGFVTKNKLHIRVADHPGDVVLRQLKINQYRYDANSHRTVVDLDEPGRVACQQADLLTLL